MKSHAALRRRHQRLFAWMSVLATVSLFSLVGVELVFPHARLGAGDAQFHRRIGHLFLRPTDQTSSHDQCPVTENN